MFVFVIKYIFLKNTLAYLFKPSDVIFMVGIAICLTYFWFVPALPSFSIYDEHNAQCTKT